ncbi:hypothetical protein [Methanococcus voltae]|uniref:Uncharacterized protein n=1 Tax=Methanococcus voltae (strain ATCC BAA-1334 / A3) TaxID=456320 RepID=D7DUF7_METV3|nr:hypothetical protein [Methanococcus voltae]MCS3900567.1 positive regulator of sigma E activity [Methanococcus voltae]
MDIFYLISILGVASIFVILGYTLIDTLSTLFGAKVIKIDLNFIKSLKISVYSSLASIILMFVPFIGLFGGVLVIIYLIKEEAQTTWKKAIMAYLVRFVVLNILLVILSITAVLTGIISVSEILNIFGNF